jgi:hypothetical protein
MSRNSRSALERLLRSALCLNRQSNEQRSVVLANVFSELVDAALESSSERLQEIAQGLISAMPRCATCLSARVVVAEQRTVRYEIQEAVPNGQGHTRLDLGTISFGMASGKPSLLCRECNTTSPMPGQYSVGSKPYLTDETENVNKATGTNAPGNPGD